MSESYSMTIRASPSLIRMAQHLVNRGHTVSLGKIQGHWDIVDLDGQGRKMPR